MGLQRYRADEAQPADPNGGIRFYAKWMSGPSLSLVRNCPVDNECVGVRRTVYVTGDSDTYFTRPAACRIRGKTIRGYLTSSESGLLFNIPTGV